MAQLTYHLFLSPAKHTLEGEEQIQEKWINLSSVEVEGIGVGAACCTKTFLFSYFFYNIYMFLFISCLLCVLPWLYSPFKGLAKEMVVIVTGKQEQNVTEEGRLCLAPAVRVIICLLIPHHLRKVNFIYTSFIARQPRFCQTGGLVPDSNSSSNLFMQISQK